MKFCVLGTKAGGAPLVNKHTSATALMLGGETILFDCSEGTQIQLRRTKISRAHINHLFLSHLHGDHILGVLPLLTTLGGDGRKTPLHIYSPKGLEEFLHLGLKIMDVKLGFELRIHELPSGFAGELATIKGHLITAQMLEHRIDSFGFRVEELPHRNIDIEKARAFGIEDGALLGRIKREGSVEVANGRTVRFADIAAPPKEARSFVYCGDTRKCRAVPALARHCSVLLHEATFRADMQDKAAERFHSTAQDAAEMALEAEVERLFITHLSVRYKSGLPLLREARTIFPQTFLAKERVEVEV
jgi:ribonuclease Z